MFKIVYIVLSFSFIQITFGQSTELSDLISPETFDSVSHIEQSIEVSESLKNKLDGVPVTSKKWMIVTSNSYASLAGAKILRLGGTAADAMVASQA